MKIRTIAKVSYKIFVGVGLGLIGADITFHFIKRGAYKLQKKMEKYIDEHTPADDDGEKDDEAE